MRFLNFLKEKPPVGIKEFPPEVKRVVEELKKVKDPETELNIVEEGLVYGVTVEDKKAMVWLLLVKSTPDCHFCQALAMNVQKRIVRDIINILRESGFGVVQVYNEMGLLLEEWREKNEESTAV
ncbi:hypothetical protein DRN44_06340 [Thermococci archaeon]|nr:MAG: hypothetical protein DRN44_06340 [Thermococci archaeon]